MGYVTILGPDLEEGVTMCGVCCIGQKQKFLADPAVQQKIDEWVNSDDGSHHLIKMQINPHLPFQAAITETPTQYSRMPMPVCWTHLGPGPQVVITPDNGGSKITPMAALPKRLLKHDG